MVDISDLDFVDDVAFCRYLTTEIGAAAIPLSAFTLAPPTALNWPALPFAKRGPP